jgi:outer membrane protein
MRVLFRASLLASVLSLMLVATAAAQTQPAAPMKIAYINSALLLQQAPGRAEAEGQFDKEVVVYRQQLQRMNDSLTAMMASFDRDAPKLDTTARNTRAKAIRDRELEYQTRARGLDSTMQARQAQLVKPIMERVQGVIEAIRTEDGYAMILDVGAQASVVVAADKRLDLTERVLARLKSQGPAPAAPVGAVPQPAGVTRPRR